MRSPRSRVVLFLSAFLVVANFGHAQTPEQQAEMILTSARKAYSEQNYPFAIQRFTEFVQKFGGHPQANNARYHLGMSYLQAPEKNYDKALESFGPIVGNQGLPEYPLTVYFAGQAYRGLGLNEVAQMAAKPNEAQQLKQRADQRFNEAVNRFTQATAAFTAKLPKEADGKVTPEADWAARARCDQAEMELRLGKYKEAKATAEPITKDATLSKTKYAKLGLYYHGYAAFQNTDYLVAGRSLSQLNPFDDPFFGLHARYLLGRVFQVTDQKAEAAQAYDAVVTGYEKSKVDATEALKKPEQFKDNPAEKARLENLLRAPLPDYVAGATFHAACLGYEAGKFSDALGKFTQFAKDFPKSELLPDVQLRIGYCQIQMKQFPEGLATLQPLMDKQPKLADQIQFWIGKGQAGVAAMNTDPAKAADRANGLKTAVATMRAAADKANQLSNNDPEAKTRRGEMMLEIADTLQLAGAPREAAQAYETILNEKTLPGRMEETTQRLIVAMHLAGDYPRADQIAREFLEKYPESPLRVPVMFRYAENAYFNALAAEKKPDFPSRQMELPKLYDEAGKRYQAVLDKGGEFERLSLAKYGLAMCHFKKGEFDKAKALLEQIPNGERSNELAYTPYLLADCLLRQTPANVSGAAETRKVLESLDAAIGNLDGFINANPKAPEVPDAMLKLGTSQARNGSMLAVQQERNVILQNARQTFEKLMQQFPKEPQAAQAKLERAKVMNLQGDKGGAMNELRQFTQDPWQNAPAAPFALTMLATLLREQNKADEAATILGAARQKLEPMLAKEPERIGLLRYHHGVCLQEAGKFAEARTALDSVGQVAANKPIHAEAGLRAGQSRIAEGRKLIETARQQLANQGLKPEQLNAANTMLQQGYAALAESIGTLERRAEELRATMPGLDARERMFYEAAWAARYLAENEVANATLKLRQERQAKLQDEINKKTPPGAKPATAPLPEVDRKEIPLQPAEQKARALYQAHIAGFSDSLLSIDSRYELAELFADRDEYDPAIKLLKDANDVEPRGDKLPTAELMDRIRIRVGTCLAAKKDYDAALAYFEAVAGNPKSPLVAQGMYRAGEVLLAKNEPAKAIEKLLVFKDKGEFQNVPNVTDRALIRLGYAYGLLKQWEPSRVSYDAVVARFGGSPFIHEARYGLGWALQNVGQFDPAVNWYAQVANSTGSELGAKAHLQIGLCRMEQKKYGDAVSSLLIVPYTFDYPELSATALCEAARALVEDKKPEQAEKLLKKVIKDHPASPWAKVAQERLEKLPKN
ncbi:tetratricopeptide repeat protein [Zavarzinella formosa]|uniref:tetratricopeptide repeat protein n=1 Tax=Zavarzinella formosa TaxID=360055 RepID=UPI000308C8AC|nr:tetratricopeptide repeat protein [Zavarzinella formosa]